MSEHRISPAEAIQRFGDAMARAGGAQVQKMEQAQRRAAVSRAAEKALADYLISRDWPNATPREVSVRHRGPYGRMAAAILAGEAWAIREAWPEAAYDIQTRSEWNKV